MTRRDPWSLVPEKVYELDSIIFDRLFTIVVLFIVSSMVVMSLRYTWESQVVPLLIGVPTLLLILTVLLLQTSDRINVLIREMSESDSLVAIQDELSTVDIEEKTDVSREQARMRLITISGWLLLFFGLVYVLGFDIGILLSLILLYRFYAKKSLLVSLGYSVVFWIVIVLIFRIALRARLFEGLIGIRLF